MPAPYRPENADPKSVNLLIGSNYAWGRSDGGMNLTAGQVYNFGQAWAEKCEDFYDGRISHLPALVSFFEGYMGVKVMTKR